MKKMLPINTDPYIRTYTHHGFFHSIVSANDKVLYSECESAADIIIKDFGLWAWEKEEKQLIYHINQDGHIIFFANKWNTGMDIAFWRECRQNDEIELSIYKQIYSNAWSSITLFITDSYTTDMTNLNSYDISLGNFAKSGVFYSTQKNIHNRIFSDSQQPITLKLVKDDKKIYIQYSDCNTNNTRILIKNLEKDYTSCRIGFAINLGDSMYYEWTLSNYIQLQCNTVNSMPIDFMVNMHKDWCVYTCNHLVDYHQKTEKEIIDNGDSLLEYIKKQINLKCYIEIDLNDNIHMGYSDENGNLFHQNLIYGYDDEQQCLYLLFYKLGKIEHITMTYSDFQSERNNQQNRTIYMLKYNPCFETYHLSPGRLLQIYKEYRDGVNISYYEPQYEIGYKLGIDCIKYFCSEEGIKYILSDIRISHLLYEHTVCNRDRVEYLLFKKIIHEDNYQKIVQVIDEEIKILLSIRNGIVKKFFGGHISEEISQERLNRTLALEQSFLDLIINALGEFNSFP